MELDKQVTDVDMEEDSTDSLPEVKADSLENPSKKAASIKIKTPKTLSSIRNQAGNAAGREVESKQPKELKEPVRNSQFNKQELDSALLVVRKVMKMDAAEPFIAPVDPIALGIPDYFDVIDTPMDFGTICADLEKGSESNQGDASGKSNSKSKGKKKPGFRRHKSDCLCAICVLMRKRKDREEKERIARGLIVEDLKQEEQSNGGSPFGDVSYSNSDDSQDNDADDDMEEKRGELTTGHPEQRQQKQSPWNRKDCDEDNEMDTRQNNEIPAQTPDELEGVDNLGPVESKKVARKNLHWNSSRKKQWLSNKT
ncbi:hypothetical protein SAY87_027447 [Trapa incisa]|uniref:Bromo domain-containing protein n=1 Tax=Trapa incisa TaxID=236973 RepID=A0AAN7GTN8_9MYRT|nr:hypothetical protein SAY87_027447 [Trapa incisa]